MDPKVEKLLEGKSDEWKFQAIAFSCACLLTGPKGDSSRDISYRHDAPRRKIRTKTTVKFSFEETSDDEESCEEYVPFQTQTMDPKVEKAPGRKIKTKAKSRSNRPSTVRILSEETSDDEESCEEYVPFQTQTMDPKVEKAPGRKIKTKAKYRSNRPSTVRFLSEDTSDDEESCEENVPFQTQTMDPKVEKAPGGKIKTKAKSRSNHPSAVRISFS